MTPRELGYGLFYLFLTVAGCWFGAEILKVFGWLNEYTLTVLVCVIVYHALRVFRDAPPED